MLKRKFILYALTFTLTLVSGLLISDYQKDNCAYEKPIQKTTGNSVATHDETVKIPPGKRININTATASQLTVLKSIGPVLAKRIVNFRKSNGDFSAIEELMNVPGINKKIFDSIKHLISVK